MFKIAKKIGAKFPYMKSRLLPTWWRFTHICWLARNAIAAMRPISVTIASSQSILLYPEGQIAELVWSAEFERTERDFIGSYLTEGMRVVNVGANIGLYTVMASSLVGASGEVHAFEPSGPTFNRLSRNIRLNNCKNVQAHRLALSNEKGQLYLRADPANVAADGHRFVEKIDSVGVVLPTDEVVESSTLDDYMLTASNGKGLVPIDMMIIDVEGAEFSVLKGGLQALATSPNLVLLLECTRNRREVEELLSTLGFNFFEWDADKKILQPCRFIDRVAIGDVIACKSYPPGVLPPTVI